MSQQGTPFGAITLLNQARISGATLSYCPLSKAIAALASTGRHASKTNCASLRIRSSVVSSFHCGRGRVHESQAWQFNQSRVRDARSNNERCGVGKIDAVRNQSVAPH